MPERLAHRDPEEFRKANQRRERRAKLAAANRGRKMTPAVMAKLRAANVGRKASPETRAKLSAAHKRAWVEGRHRKVYWTKDEEALGTNIDRVVAAQLGRPWKRVAERRQALGIPSYRERHGYAAAVAR